MLDGVFNLYSLTDKDMNALLRVLPLVNRFHPDLQEQAILNAKCVTSAMGKLSHKEHSFTSDEVRVMAVAVGAARLICSGVYLPELSDLGFWEKRSIKKLSQEYDELTLLFSDCIRRIDVDPE